MGIRARSARRRQQLGELDEIMPLNNSGARLNFSEL